MPSLTVHLALTTLLTDTESSFRSELQSKQSLLDQAHIKLRESTAGLAKERQQLANIKQKSVDRNALRQRIANLRLANEQKRAIISANSRPATKSSDIRTDIKIGEADAGLEIDMNVLGNPNDPFVMTTQKRGYITTLPSTAILNARAIAYRKHNARLEAEAKHLQSQSSGLEKQIRQLVSLCTGMKESEVDQMVDNLSAAVASEGGDDVEVGRVREFLRKVEGINNE